MSYPAIPQYSNLFLLLALVLRIFGLRCCWSGSFVVAVATDTPS